MESSMVDGERLERAEVSHPPAPRTVTETGFGMNFLLSLLIKCVYMNALESASQIAEKLKLSNRIVVAVLEDAKDKDLLEALGRVGDGLTAELRYALTAKGREWAVDALNHSLYVGPAPVRLPDYHAQVERQRITRERVEAETLERCFAGMVLPSDFVTYVGPAVNSGRSILLYGPPGNGKTIIAEAIGRAFADTIYVPYSLEVDGQVINIFDSTIHTEIDPPSEPEAAADVAGPARAQETDPRWVPCRRPLVITGGELTLEMLDLSFNPYSRVYEAPMQLKATGGIFVIDDFGRQRVTPAEVLNRWIIPLEGGRDYLTLHTGKKFPVPFDELVIFSTNLEQDALMDAATRRRIYYKIEIDAPGEDEYRDIFRRECERKEIELPDDVVPYLMDEYYDKGGRPISRYHPKWIVDQVVGACEYRGLTPRLDKELIAEALQNL